MRPRPLAALLRLALLALACVLVAPPAAAQERDARLPRASPNATVAQTLGVTDVTVTYGRPAVKGRTIFGDLVPYDAVWRTGANEATTITFSTDVEVQGEPVDAGTYGLFTRPGATTWTVILNGEPAQWGAYRYDESKDVVRVEATPENAQARELLTFQFEDVTETEATLALYWADVRVPVTLTADTRSLVRANAEEALAAGDGWRAVFPFVRYAVQQELYLDEATGWARQMVEMEANYATLALAATTHAAAKEYAEAAALGERALAAAESMDEAPRGLDDLRAQVASWKTQG
jgi:hypothetical protein